MEPEGSLPHSQVPTTCPYPDPARSSPHPHIQLPWTTILLSSHLRLGIPSGIFHSGYPTKTPYTRLLSPLTRYMPRSSHFSRFYLPNNIGWAVQIIKHLFFWFSPLPCYLVPLRPKYSPQHSIYSQTPQPTFFHQCQRPSFTPIQNNRQNYSSVYLNL